MAKTDGTVWSWGSNTGGQLGDGTTTQRTSPVQISNFSGVIAVAAGVSHSVALKSDGTVWSWGANANGELGDGSTTQRNSPVQVSGLTGVIAIACGGNHSLALKSDGTVWTWGLNSNGQVGDSSTTQRTSPVQATGLSNIVLLAGGGAFSLAVKNDGTAWAWGLNSSGQLGDGTTTQRTSAVAVSSLTAVVAIAGGSTHGLAIKSDGTAWSWGANNQYQLGDGTGTQRTSPVQVTGVTGAVSIAAGVYQSLIVKSNGTAWGWGSSSDGQLGAGSTGTLHWTAVQVTGITNGAIIACGGSHTLLAMADGSIRAWGDNAYGQLGDSTTTDRSTPKSILTDISPPTTPPALYATGVTLTAASLTWLPASDNVGVTGYEVLSNGVSLGTTNSLFMDITGLSAADRRGFSVRARDAVGNWSPEVGVIVTYADTTAPAAPVVLGAAEITATTVILVWTPSTDNVAVTGYNVYRGGSFIGTTTNLYYKDSGRTASTAYTYTVKAFDAATNLSSAGTLNVTTTASTTADADGDGLPDLTETALGTNGSTAATADTTNQTQLDVHRPLPQP